MTSCTNDDRSPTKAWKRAENKYLNTSDTNLSPIKLGMALIRPDYIDDVTMKSNFWVLHMSEQFHYDNTISIVAVKHDNEDELKKILLLNINQISLIYIRQYWTNITPLGFGAFGSVSKVYNNDINEDIAVKYVKNRPKNHIYRNMLEVLRERNYILKAYQSPYMVRLLKSFSLKEFNGHFLCFDYCIGDLFKFCKKLIQPSRHVFQIIYLKMGLMKTEYERISQSMNIDLVFLFKIYIFEMFAILDYLAKCNIVHCDIKPQNLMISKDLHLKLGDFGLINNIHYITDPGQFMYANEASKDNINFARNGRGAKGTSGYYDLEICHDYVKSHNSTFYNYILGKSSQLVCQIPTNTKHTNNFMSDLWSMGITALQLLFFGYLIVEPANIPSAVRDLFRNDSLNDRNSFTLVLFWFSPIFNKIFSGFINEYKDLFSLELTNFLFSCFTNRDTRGGDYTKEKSIQVYEDKISFRQFDITKFEQMNVFRELNITIHTCCTVNLDAVPRFFVQNQVGQNVEEYLSSLKKLDGTSGNAQSKLLCPGINLRMA